MSVGSLESVQTSHAASAVMTEPLSSSVQAPRIAEIVADQSDLESRQDAKFFLLRGCELDRTLCDAQCTGYTLTSTTEAEALRDFDSRMAMVSELLWKDGWTRDQDTAARHGQKFREELRFIGQKEFDAGVESIARRWLEKLDSSRMGELFVAVCRDESSSLVYGATESALRALNPDAVDKVQPIDMEQLYSAGARIIDRVAQTGLIYVDDWTISGEQLTDMITRAPEAIRRGPGGIEVNVICATDRHVNIGLGGVACRSHFVYPYTYEDTQRVSITGAHCDTDYGFRSQISGVLSTLHNMGSLMRSASNQRHDYEGVPYPLLYRVMRDYRPTSGDTAKVMITPQEQNILAERRQRCAAGLSRMVSVATL